MEKEERCRSSQGASQASSGRTSLAEEMIETERHGIEARELDDDEVSDWSMVVNVSTCGSSQNEADLQADPDETYFSDNDEGDVTEEDERNNTRSSLSTQDPEDEQEQFADCMEFSSSDDDESKHKAVETSSME